MFFRCSTSLMYAGSWFRFARGNLQGGRALHSIKKIKLRKRSPTSVLQRIPYPKHLYSSQQTNQSQPKSKGENETDEVKRKEYSYKSNSSGKDFLGSKPLEYSENIYTVPNMLTLGRFLVTPYLGYLVIQGSHGWACGIFIAASITDFLDGYIARNFEGQSSVIGTVIDPLADKFLISVLALSLGYVSLIPVWLVGLIFSRDLFLVVKGFYLRYQTIPPPKTWKRYWDFSRPTAHIKPSLVSKVNTNLQMILFSTCLLSPLINLPTDHPLLTALYFSTAVTTTWSMVDYIYNKPYVLLDECEQRKAETAKKKEG